MNTSEQLRRKAEALVRKLKAAGKGQKPSTDDVETLIHELSVHQVELEMQGEELRSFSESLRRDNERYREHFLTSPIPSLRLDQEGRILEINHAAKELLGLRHSPEETVVRSLYHSGAWIPNHHAFRKLVKQSLTTGSACAEEIRFRGPRQQERILEVRIKSLQGEGHPGSGPQLLVFLQDRTAEIRAREDLAERFRTLDLVLESELTGYWDWELPADRIYYSPSWCRMLGYGPRELEESPETFRRLMHPDDRIVAEQRMELHLKPGGTSSYYHESRFRHKQGHWVWIICSGRVVERDDAGHPLRMVGCHIDITQRKTNEEGLRQASDILQNMQMGLYVYALEDPEDDRSLRLVAANPASGNLTGVPPEDILDKKIDEIFPGLREQEIPRRFAEVVRSGRAGEFEDLYYGEDRVLEAAYTVKAFPLPDNRVGVTFDNITEKKRAQERLANSEDRFRTLFEDSPVRCLIHDAETGDILEANQASMDSFGFERFEQFAEENIWLREEPYTFEAACENLRKARDHGTRTFVWKNRSLRGDIFWEMVTLQRIDLDGKVRILSSSVDITRQIEQELYLEAMRKRAEAQLQFPRLLEELGEEGFLEAALGILRGQTQSGLAFLHRVSPEDQSLHRITCQGCPKSGACPMVRGKGTPLDSAGPWALCAREKRPLLGKAGDISWRCSQGMVQVETYISVPVIENGEAAMVLVVANRAAGDYSDVDLETVQTFANDIWTLIQRRRGQEALRAGEERLRLLSEQVPGVVYEFQMFEDGRFAYPYVSSHARDALGLNPEDIQSDPDLFMRHVHPGDAEQLWLANAASRETLQLWNCEFRYQHPEKGLIWLWGAANPSRQSDGSVLWHGYIADITGRKAAEKEIEDLSKMRSLIMRIASSSINMPREQVDRSLNDSLKEIGEFVQADRVYIFDYDWEKNVCNNTYEWCSEGTTPEIENLQGVPNDVIDYWVQAHKNGREMSIGDVMSLPPDDGVRQILEPQGVKSVLALPMMKGDSCIGFIGFDSVRKIHTYSEQEKDLLKIFSEVLVNIHERKLAEVELRRLSTAIEQSPETVVITDRWSKILYVNPAFEKTTGYTREEALGENPRVLRSGEHDRAFYQSMWNTLLEGTTWEGRIVNKRKDGSLFTEEATISPIRDEKGDIINYVAIKRDITAELEREEMLMQSQKMETVGRLASGVAHDFNNLLTGIMGLTELCKLSLPEDHDVQQNLDDILEAVNRSAGITRQLLAFARKQTVSPRAVNLNQAISDTLKLLGGLIGENVHLHFEPGLDIPSIFIDPGQVDQILTNLCVNAKDAIDDVGEITLVTSREPPSAGETLPRVCLQVQDTGHGMSAEILQNIFEPFFTTKAPGRGTGLGLATVYGIVTQNRGTLEVESTPGQGTCFRICFPGVPGGDAEGSSGSTRALPEGNATILFVDDELLICKSVKYGLEKVGYRLETASSPEEALRLVDETDIRFDLLITDVVMPGMNGRDLADRLTERIPGLRRLFISGYNADIISDQGILDEGLHFLAKPFTLEDLSRKVNEILSGG